MLQGIETADKKSMPVLSIPGESLLTDSELHSLLSRSGAQGQSRTHRKIYWSSLTF